MATNDFLPFASTDTGTNLLTQAEYLADTQRPIGNQSGVARSKFNNKVLRQSSFMSAVVAKYISDTSVVDVLDNGDLAGMAAKLATAIQTTASGATNRIGLIDYGYVAKNYHIVAFGGEFNRADYPKLWAHLQANPTLVKTEAQWQTEATANGGICGFFSDGNGTTTFRVPNLNNAFLRPTIRAVGSYQADAFKSHVHTSSATPIAGSNRPIGGGIFEAATNGTGTGSTGADETRPINIAVLPLIVAK